MSVHDRLVVCLLDQIACSGISLLYGKVCLDSCLSLVGQRRTVHVFYPLLKFFFRWIGAVNRRSRLLPPRLSDCSQVNGIESDSINKLSDDLFRLGIVTGYGMSNNGLYFRQGAPPPPRSKAVIRRPQPNEYAENNIDYINQVPGEDILSFLQQQLDSTMALLNTIDETLSTHRYEAGKWSVREVFGHIIDAERVFAYRALAFGRGVRRRFLASTRNPGHAMPTTTT